MIVNGGSSVGKTSLCRALQDMLWERKRQLYCLLGIDAFWLSLPPKQLDVRRVEAEFYTTETYEDNGLPYFIVHPGPLLDEVMYARHRAIKAAGVARGCGAAGRGSGGIYALCGNAAS